MEEVAWDGAAPPRTSGAGYWTRRRRIVAADAQRAASGASARLRLACYKQALAAAGIRFDPRRVASALAWHRTDGAVAVR